MIRTIEISPGSTVQHNEASENTIRENLDLFFKTKHGKRETHTFYRGFIIVRNTVEFTGCKPERTTTLYIYLFDGFKDNSSPNVLHVNGAGNSVKSAKRRIDDILEHGTIARWKTGDGKRFHTKDDALQHAHKVFKQSGKVVAVVQ